MPLILPSNSISAVGYEVDNSLRFDDGSSDYLSFTPSNETLDKLTLSCWVKRSSLGSTQRIYSHNSSYYLYYRFESSDIFRFIISGGSGLFRLDTSRVFRDTSAWYHILVTLDSTQATASDRLKLWVNGVQETSFSATGYPNLNETVSVFSNSKSFEIGRYETSAEYFDGYMAELVVASGQALDPTSFGEFDEDTGIWKPIDVSGLTFGTNGFYLDFENSGSLGADVSGNGNNFTVNNLTSIDQTTDTPTNNFATWNPLWSQSSGNIGDVTFSEGNLKSDTTIDYRTFPATMGFNSGKWYWEIKRYEDDGSADMHTGVMSENAKPANTATWIGNQANGWVFASDVGSTYTGGTETNTGYSSAGSAGDIVQVAFDADNGKIYFGVNGTWQNSGNPATGTNPAYTGLDTSLFYFPCTSTGSDVEANFGNPPYTISSGNSDGNGMGNFEYSVPSGYFALNTKNLAEYG